MMDDLTLAFSALRAALEERDVKIKPSEGNNPYFTAYTETNEYGNPGDGIFVHNRTGHNMFRWGMFNQHSMEDIEGAAQHISEYLLTTKIIRDRAADVDKPLTE